MSLGRLLVLALVLVCAGCGPRGGKARKPTVPVRGLVLLEDKPLPGAVVVFHPLDDPAPEAPRSYARTSPDGGFALATYETGDGAPAGRYAVVILALDGEEGTSLIPARYGSVESSGLRADIKEGNNELPPFRLRRQ